jgi:transposase
MSTCRKPYPSDVSTEEWLLVAPYLLLQREDAGQREHDLSEVFSGLRYIVKTGAPWRWMPNDLPPWAAVYQQTQRWLAAGCFEALVDDLRAVLRLAAVVRPNRPRQSSIVGRCVPRPRAASVPAMTVGSARRVRRSTWPSTRWAICWRFMSHPEAQKTAARWSGSRVPSRPLPTTQSNLPGSIRVIPVSVPPMPQQNMASLSRSSDCPRPNAASFSCHDAGSSNDHAHGRPTSGASSKTMSDMRKHSQNFTSSPSPAS